MRWCHVFWFALVWCLVVTVDGCCTSRRCLVANHMINKYSKKDWKLTGRMLMPMTAMEFHAFLNNHQEQYDAAIIQDRLRNEITNSLTIGTIDDLLDVHRQLMGLALRQLRTELLQRLNPNPGAMIQTALAYSEYRNNVLFLQNLIAQSEDSYDALKKLLRKDKDDEDSPEGDDFYSFGGGLFGKGKTSGGKTGGYKSGGMGYDYEGPGMDYGYTKGSDQPTNEMASNVCHLADNACLLSQSISVATGLGGYPKNILSDGASPTYPLVCSLNSNYNQCFSRPTEKVEKIEDQPKQSWWEWLGLDSLSNVDNKGFFIRTFPK